MFYPSLSVAEEDRTPVHSPLTSARQVPVAGEAASRVLHLADLADGQHTLCGLPLSSVAMGGYCEHLDGNHDLPDFMRTIFALDGRQGEPCAECLARQPATLATTTESRR